MRMEKKSGFGWRLLESNCLRMLVVLGHWRCRYWVYRPRSNRSTADMNHGVSKNVRDICCLNNCLGIYASDASAIINIQRLANLSLDCL